MRFGSLFAGIGGFDLGLERAGMECAWQVEIDSYAQAVLAKHWPHVPRWEDVRTFPPEGDWSVDLICGGFPCQDISVAGRGAGLAGERSGLWFEFARIVGVLRPRYVVVENVAALLTRGMDAVLGTLSTLGYDSEWHVIPASAVGAPHRRERVWIVATRRQDVGKPIGRGQSRISWRWAEPKPADGRGDVADADNQGESDVPVDAISRHCMPQSASGYGWWATEPDVGRVAHGVPARVDRLRCLGNAVVPQVVEVIGRAILAHEARLAEVQR